MRDVSYTFVVVAIEILWLAKKRHVIYEVLVLSPSHYYNGMRVMLVL